MTDFLTQKCLKWMKKPDPPATRPMCGWNKKLQEGSVPVAVLLISVITDKWFTSITTQYMYLCMYFTNFPRRWRGRKCWPCPNLWTLIWPAGQWQVWVPSPGLHVWNRCRRLRPHSCLPAKAPWCTPQKDTIFSSAWRCQQSSWNRNLSVVRPSVRVAIISEPNARISFKF